ncbi:MAG: Gfo/Idh/MocA family oxidoreductase [Phycisphaerae bacterium]|nr:Gfo/Idh/MocA family oxidoreductase [Phycisphaerae bacterium]MCZ2398376.1 Gfo/Idh/MocA family oxidoreductase [Phycisphaerae bacterium]NUQ50806.1 Gfo/Idh/MocA family oxidoreductase [Phycisphaerae bacterium]
MPRSPVRSAHLTRRQFVRGAAALAASGFAALPSLAHARRAAANERLTIGLVGVGNMGSGHLDALLGNPDVQLLAVCDVDAVKRDAARRKAEEHYGGATRSGEYRAVEATNAFEDVLARDDIDAVLIAVPDHWHAIIAIAACRAGKDVYCEKPLSLTIRQAWEMVAAARRYNSVFQVGSQQRSEDNFRHACELVRSGRIGALREVRVGIGGPSRDKQFAEQPPRPGLDWDRWLGPAPWQPYNADRCSGDYNGGWRHVRDYSGGMTTDWGAHHYDIAQWGMGMDGSGCGPIEIVPPPEMPDIRKNPDPDKEPVLRFTYPTGVTMVHGGANGVKFIGSDGVIEVNRGYLKSWPDAIAKSRLGPDDVHLYRSRSHHQDWIECIRTRRRPVADVEIGASTITTCHLANIAFWTGRTIRWDPQRREIIDDAAAARWLDRPMRAPWRLHL